MKKGDLRRITEKRLFKENLSAVLVGVLAVAMVGALVLLFWQKGTQRVDTSDFDGRIVDRWADYNGPKQVSQPYFRLAVEGDDGKRFTVKVDPGVYESARVGMRIKRRAGQIVLIDTEVKTPGK